MKKTRVYELAKEFRKDTREVLDLLHEMGVEAVSHASSLSEQEAEKVRETLSAQQTHKIIQKRISSGVIRRRVKAIQPQPEPEAPPVEPDLVEPTQVEPAPVEPAAVGQAAVEPAAVEPAAVEPEPEVPAPMQPVAVEAAAEPEPGPEPETPPAEAPAAPEIEAAPEKAPVEAEPAAEPEAKPAETSIEEEIPQVRKPRWAQRGERARIISKPSRPMTPSELGAGPQPAPNLLPSLEPEVQPSPDKEEGRRRRGKGEAGRRRGKKRDVTRAELYTGREGKFRAAKIKKGAKKTLKTQITTPKAIKMRIKIGEAISVAELAKRMGVKATEVVRQLMSMGMIVAASQSIDLETAAIVAGEFGYEVEKAAFEEAEFLKVADDQEADLKSRPPVVTIMGHVDHGKSSLLEAISTHNISIVQGEAGGITQHIGAYRVEVDGADIIFLDTPGHEAFTAMRARGAQVTDIVVLVVAADDGVMEQTREAVNHSRAAKVPIIVAVNKIDKPDVNPDRVKRQLSEMGLNPEEWGGDTLFVNVSAKTGQGIEDLLEAIRLQAEVLELKANPDRPATGRIIEAQLDRGRGALATVLIQGGTLKVGDAFVVGSHSGKVRALLDDRGRPVDEAGPSIPVQILGLSGVPEAGDDFMVVEDDRTARQVSEHRQTKRREAELSQTTKLSLESFLERAEEGEVKELPIVIKADVQGSIEALREALEKQSTDKVKLNVIQSGVGAITESDVLLASASRAIIIGFTVRANPKVAELLEAEQVEVRYYDVIYKVIEDIRKAMTGLLESIFEERPLGRAEVREVFKVPKVGAVAGCHVADGQLKRGAQVRLLRDGVVIYTGRIASLRRFKEDVKEVSAGFECGAGLENFNDIKPGDFLEAYELEEIRPTLED